MDTNYARNYVTDTVKKNPTAVYISIAVALLLLLCLSSSSSVGGYLFYNNYIDEDEEKE